MYKNFVNLYIIQLTPQKLSAEWKNRTGAEGASAWPALGQKKTKRGIEGEKNGLCVVRIS